MPPDGYLHRASYRSSTDDDIESAGAWRDRLDCPELRRLSFSLRRVS
jgi:hypothetical protein